MTLVSTNKLIRLLLALIIGFSPLSSVMADSPVEDTGEQGVSHSMHHDANMDKPACGSELEDCAEKCATQQCATQHCGMSISGTLPSNSWTTPYSNYSYHITSLYYAEGQHVDAFYRPPRG